MPEFKATRGRAACKKKAEELAPYVEAALKRKQWMKPLADDEIPPVLALGRQIAEEAARKGEAPRAAGARAPAWAKPLEKPARRKGSKEKA